MIETLFEAALQKTKTIKLEMKYSASITESNLVFPFNIQNKANFVYLERYVLFAKGTSNELLITFLLCLTLISGCKFTFL